MANVLVCYQVEELNVRLGVGINLESDICWRKSANALLGSMAAGGALELHDSFKDGQKEHWIQETVREEKNYLLILRERR